jgi:hypothetical protein
MSATTQKVMFQAVSPEPVMDGALALSSALGVPEDFTPATKAQVE